MPSNKEEGMPLEFEFQVNLTKVRRRMPAADPRAPDARIHPLVRTLALAHRIDALVQQKALRNRSEACHILGVTASRVCQIMALLLLAPAIQEALLGASPERLSTLTERQLLAMAAVPDWTAQVVLWSRL